MTTSIVFSVIGEPTRDLLALLDEFQQSRKVQVKLEQMEWDGAWAKLLSYALLGKGPDVSHIGSTWASSLVAMNALRKFEPKEVEALGGPGVFVAPAWQSAVMDESVWSVPWSSFTFLVHYRRDHLEAAGIAEAHAFDTPQDFHNTIQRLKEHNFTSPLILPSGEPYLDRVHIAASWMWGAGGDYFSHGGREILLDRPKTRAGLQAFFELYRLMSPRDYQLSYEQSLDRFTRGEASVIIADCSFPSILRLQNPELANMVGVHPLPGVPFVSGDNLIIWHEARHSLERERAALDLVSFLVSAPAQKRFCESMQQFPVRHDALDALQSPLSNLVPILKETFEHGHSHRPMRLWCRFEQQLGSTYDELTNALIANTNQPVTVILESHLSELQQRFAILLG